MKRILNQIALILLVATIILSCNKEEDNFKPLTWKETTLLSIEAGEDRNFIVGLDEGIPVQMNTGEITVGIDLEYDGDIPVSEVTLYVQLEENVDGVITRYGDDADVVLAVIDDFSDLANLTLTLNADDMYALFASFFDASRTGNEVLALPGDIFEITWSIKGTDGSIADSTDECFGPGCQYGIAVVGKTAIFNWWDGVFDYEWTDAAPGVIEWGDYYGGDPIFVGATGTIEFTATLKNGESTIPNSVFYYWFHPDMDYDTYPEYPTGVINHNELTGQFEMTDDTDYGIIWIISNIDGASIDVYWEIPDYYGGASGEYGTLTITRTDDLDWPTNIYQYAGEAPEEDVWDGTFTYEWIETTATLESYGSYYGQPELFLGAIGSIDCASTGTPDEYSVSHTFFQYYYADGAGTLTFNYATGEVVVTGGNEETWEMTNVDGRNMDIEVGWDGYPDEKGKVRLTRTDSYHWPSNIYIDFEFSD